MYCIQKYKDQGTSLNKEQKHSKSIISNLIRHMPRWLANMVEIMAQSPICFKENLHDTNHTVDV